MATEFLKDYNFNVTWDITKQSEMSMSYIDLMTLAGVYVYPKAGMTLTEKQEETNKLIESTEVFDINIFAVVYYSNYGKLMQKQIGNKFSLANLSINKYKFSDIERVSSLALYGIDALTLTIDPKYFEPADTANDEIVVNPSYGGFDLYFTINDPLPREGSHTHTMYGRVSPATEDVPADKDEKEDVPDDKDFVISFDKFKPGFNLDIDKDSSININNPDDSLTDQEKSDLEDLVSKYVFINSMSYYNIRHKTINPGSLTLKSSLLHIQIVQTCPIAFTLTLHLNVYEIDKDEPTKIIKTYSYEPHGVNISNVMGEHLTKMNNPDVSYALLRTNPKLTGNVKVVVDSNSNLYLDTFKISDALSERKYRHISVGSSTYYGKSLMTKFKDLPSSEFYKIPDSCYSLFTPAQTYKNEYFDVYNSGVSTNSDELYSENFSILAPLCIKRVMPDFFLVFKVNRDANGYNELSMSDDQKIEFFIKHGKLIKSYDMRKNSNIGTYIRNVYDHSKTYAGDMFASYDTDNYNKFIGISLDKGVVTAMYETPYEQEKVNNQVALNDFFTKGFERNHIVSKDIINFEFLFDDLEDEMFSINTYFGIYVKLNSDSENGFSCIGSHPSETYTNIIEYDYDSSVHSFDTNEYLSDIPQYASLIYGVSTPNEFIRLNTSLKYSSINENFLLKPYKNILTTNIYKTPASTCKSFLTFALNDIFDVGDHIRVIIPELKTIYEVIMSDEDSLDTIQGTYTDEYKLSDVVTNYYNDHNTGWVIKRISMFIPYKSVVKDPAVVYNDETGLSRIAKTVVSTVMTQIEQLFFAFKKFDDAEVFTSWKYNDIGMSLISNCENVIFERICSASGFIQSQYDYLLNTTDEDKTIEFFGSIYPKKTILNIDETKWEYFSNFYLYPIHFELVGTRMAYIIDFVKISDISDDYVYSGCIDDLKIFDNKSIVYIQNDASGAVSTLYQDIPLHAYTNTANSEIIGTYNISVRWLTSFDNLSNKILNIRKPKITNTQVLMYSTYPINSGICSIIQVKDFDFDVLDNDNALLDYEPDDVIGSKGEYAEQSIFNLTAPEDEDIVPGVDVEDDKNYLYVNNGQVKTLDSELNTKSEQYKTEIKDLTDRINALPEDDEERAELQKQLDEHTAAFTEFINTVYVCVPILDTVETNGNICELYDTESYYYKRNLKCKIEIPAVDENEDDPVPPSVSEYTTVWSWGEKQSSTSEISFVYPTSYSMDPLRSTSEESIKNYIDKYKIADPVLYEKPWYNIGEETSRSAFLDNLFKKNHTKFDISLTAPYCCKWKSIGTDARGDDLKLMYYDASIGVDSYYIVGPNAADCSTYIGYLYAPANDVPTDGSNEFSYALDKKYISRSIDQIIKDTSDKTVKLYTFKDFILNGNGAIDDMIYNTNTQDNRFSISYMSGANTLEFISAGVKFRIKSNNDNIIDFNSYAGYPVIFIVLPIANPSYNKNTEIIIDEIKQEMIFIWYNPSTTLKMGYSQDPANANLANTTSYLCPIPLDCSLSDLILKYVRENSNTDSRTYASVSIPDSLDLESQPSYFDGLRIVDTTDGKKQTDIAKTIEYRTSHLGKKLANEKSYLYLSSIFMDSDAYTKPETGAISCELLPTKPLYEDFYKTYPYYHVKDYITGISPVIWYDADGKDATNAGIEDLASIVGNHINTYLLVDNANNVVASNASYDNFKKVVNNCSIYVKTDNGLKDFTNVTNLLNIEIVDPIPYYKYKNIEHNKNTNENRTKIGTVHPTYAEPVMKNVFEFDYSTASRINRVNTLYDVVPDADTIDDVFNKSFDGANVSIKHINVINQLWINKYTETSNYCQQESAAEDEFTKYRLSVDVLKNVSVIQDTWAFNTYRKYRIEQADGKDKESYSGVKGYKTGYEMKSFFNSKAIVLNGADGNKIEITSWKNTEISKTKKYIKLDVTDSLVYNILFRPAFSAAWKYLGINSNDYKINYIKNTILNFININNKTKFILVKDSVKNSSLSFMTDYEENGTELVTNFKNELKYENGKYYMYIYPEDTYTYYAKMIITL